MICLGTSCFWHMLSPSHSTASVMAPSWKRRSSEREPHSWRNSPAWQKSATVVNNESLHKHTYMMKKQVYKTVKVQTLCSTFDIALIQSEVKGPCIFNPMGKVRNKERKKEHMHTFHYLGAVCRWASLQDGGCQLRP